MIKIKDKMVSWSKAFCKKHKLSSTPVKESDITPYDYFTQARSWADDFYTAVETSRNRWKAAVLWVLTPITMLLLVCIATLLPMQHLVPLMVNHYQNGIVTVTPFKQAYAPINQAQVESDIARYIRFRESYSSDTYDYSYRLINLMSSDAISKTYEQTQSATNKNSPINRLGNKGYQTIKIESIVFLDNEDKNEKNTTDQIHRNLAQVDFVVTSVNYKTGQENAMPLTALVSWKYKGMPDNPSDRWMDWNGFTVTTYQVQQRNV